MRTTRRTHAPFAAVTSLPLAAALLLGVAAPARADLTGVDRDFATQAQRANIAAIQDAQWGEKSTASEPLKQLAQKIIKNRTTASAELKTLAQQQNFSLPPLPTGGQQDAAASLRDKRGSDLERAYAQHEIERHQQQIALYQREITDGKDQSLRDYAQRNLPVLKDELGSAQTVATGK